ncbi:hypothetical protein DFH07DRAFT_960339 [Mycena maculata]|uniref:Uncharacterized protein n=1 Tax=Mycena maculata TaxID=230809 RepID=A0AAD7NAY3_9AGAR|nr:hypothetical protein DFH07DRAFT_960339 [Mycena maculata]
MSDEDGLNLVERIGCFTNRSRLGRVAINAMSGSKIAFKSKVVSKVHVEVWCEAARTWERCWASGFFPANTESPEILAKKVLNLSPLS